MLKRETEVQRLSRTLLVKCSSSMLFILILLLGVDSTGGTLNLAKRAL